MQKQHVVLLITFLGATGAMLASLGGWDELKDIKVVGSFIVQLATMLGALYGVPATTTNKTVKKTLKATKLTGILLLVGLSTALSTGCALTRHKLTVADTTLAQALFAVQDVEFDLHDKGVIDQANHVEFNATFAPLLEDGLRVNRLIRALPKGAPAPAELLDLAKRMAVLAVRVEARIPSPAASPLRDRLKAALEVVDAALKMFTLTTPGADRWELRPLPHC